jgi:hypothetical protein
MRLVLSKPPLHTWTLHIHGVATIEHSEGIGRMLRTIERALAKEPRPVQPADMEPDEEPYGRQCGLFYQIPYCPRSQFLGWEYFGADSEDTVLKHAMQAAEALGVELELE